ncbi:hypothetical protein [Sphingomonas sp. BK481]|jgi:hypothetical protein|nr:hypothetical protein [Sphingomonas sp. BK481]
MACNVDDLQKQFTALERRKHGDAQRCRVEIRAGKEDYVLSIGASPSTY